MNTDTHRFYPCSSFYLWFISHLSPWSVSPQTIYYFAPFRGDTNWGVGITPTLFIAQSYLTTDEHRFTQILFVFIFFICGSFLIYLHDLCLHRPFIILLLNHPVLLTPLHGRGRHKKRIAFWAILFIVFKIF